MESDLITRSQIAERLGVSRVRVQQLTGKSNFPEPAGTVGRAVAYREEDVAAWALGADAATAWTAATTCGSST